MALQQQKFTHVIGVRTGRFLSAQTLLQLASVPGIAGVKHAAGAIDHDTIMLMASRPDDFAVLAGDDMFASPLLALGAAGGILAAAHLCTGEFAALIAAWHSGRAGQARELGHRLAPLSAALFAEPNPAVIKGALHAQGKIPSPAVRLPLLPHARTRYARPPACSARFRAPYRLTCRHQSRYAKLVRCVARFSAVSPGFSRRVFSWRIFCMSIR